MKKSKAMKKSLDIEFIYSKTSQKFFDKHTKIQNRFEDNIVSKYRGNENIDVKKMTGYQDLFRMRVGDYRVIYKLEENQIVIVSILLAGSRGEIYKKLK